MKPIVVQKYGGSSVADVDRIRAVAERVVRTKEAGKEVVVVVSAMGKTTDELLARARKISSSPSRRELDMLLTCGERASMALLSMAVGELGHEAISFTGSQSGIMTNDRHSGARIIEVRPVRIQDELERGRIVIVAGFQGVSYKREITTLGRGGSDTTAVALAGALGAEYAEICSDVDGVYTADPRVVDAARLLDAISHDEMLELSTHGAKVLHAQCVEFARRADIALYARATTGGGAGTRIDRDGGAQKVSGVAGARGLVHLAVSSEAALEAVLQVAEDASLALLHLVQIGPRADIWLGLADVPDWPSVRQRLVASAGAALTIEDGHGAVTAVGLGLGESAAEVARVRRIAATAGVTLWAVATSPLRITAFCRDDDVDLLVRAAHEALCE